MESARRKKSALIFLLVALSAAEKSSFHEGKGVARPVGALSGEAGGKFSLRAQISLKFFPIDSLRLQPLHLIHFLFTPAIFVLAHRLQIRNRPWTGQAKIRNFIFLARPKMA